MLEVRGLAQQVLQRVSGRQRLERSDEIPNLVISGTDTDPSAELLQHVDAGPSVRRIDHELHRALRLEHAAQSAEPRIGVREMMENTGADDLVEGRLQLACPLDGQLVDLEIVQFVFSFELLSTAHARRAKVDARNLRRGPTQGMLCRLGCSAAGNQNGELFPKGSGRPEQMIIRAASQRVLPEALIFIEARPPDGDTDTFRRSRWTSAATSKYGDCCSPCWLIENINRQLRRPTSMPRRTHCSAGESGSCTCRELAPSATACVTCRPSCRWRAQPSPGRG